MKIPNVRILLALTAIVSLSGCSDQRVDSSSADTPQPAAGASDVERWNSTDQVEVGRTVFRENCAVCHGQEAQGTAGDWRERLADGSFPPPPLDGSAHAWHHPQEILLRVIDYGGEAMGGKMPAFIDVLDDAEKLAAIAYFQSFWADEIYQQWIQMGGTN